MIDILNIQVPLWTLLVTILGLIVAIIGLFIQHGQLSIAKKQADVSEKDIKFQWLIKSEKDFIEKFKVYMEEHCKADPKVLTIDTIIADCKASIKKFKDRNMDIKFIDELEAFVAEGEQIIIEKDKYK